MISKKPPINIGLVGCGVISKTHFSAIKSLNKARLVCVCDNDKKRAKETGEELGIKWYTSYKEMLKDKEIDLISVCTPHDLHAPMGISAARAGKHVLMEKPLGLGKGKVSGMLQEFKKNKKKLFTVLQVRYNPTVVAVRDAINKGKLGRINNAGLVVRWYRPQEYFDRDEWRGSKKQEGGLLYSQGIHYIDIMQWLMGSVKNVYGKTMTVAHKIETDDLAIANIEHNNGAYTTVEIGLCTYPKNLECSFTIMGSKGTIKISGSALDEIEAWMVEDMPLPKIKPCIHPNVYAGGLYQGSCPNHVFVYKDLLDDLLKGTNTCTTGLDSLKALEISNAIYKSSKLGRKVKL